LRQAYDYWQDQPDYYLRAKLLWTRRYNAGPRGTVQVVRFGKKLYDPQDSLR